jgi:hypothetical protein
MVAFKYFPWQRGTQHLSCEFPQRPAFSLHPVSPCRCSSPPSFFHLPSTFNPSTCCLLQQTATELFSRYGPHVPSFSEGGFDEVMREGQRRNCPVMVYLHSDLHGDTEDFLRGTLCTQEVCEAVQGVGYLSWVGRVHERVGWEASLKLEAHAFPFLAVFMPQEGPAGVRSVRVWALEGGPLPSPTTLGGELRKWGSAARGVLEGAAATRAGAAAARNWERELRVTQEREYAEAEAADAARERERVEAGAAVAAAQAATAQAEAAAEEEAELATALKLSLRSDVEEEVEAARKRLAASGPEPELLGAGGSGSSGSSGSAGGEVTAVRFTLPGGKTRLQRNFLKSHPLSLLVDYLVVTSVELGETLDPGTFDLSTTAPRAVYDAHSAAGREKLRGTTVASAGLSGAMVIVKKVAVVEGGGGQQ